MSSRVKWAFSPPSVFAGLSVNRRVLKRVITVFLCFLAIGRIWVYRDNPQTKVMIVSTVMGRVGYVRLLSETLDWLNVYDKSTVRLFVDETRELKVPEVKRMFPRAKVQKIVHEFKPKTSPDIATRMAFEYFYRSGYGILLNIDSDTALHVNWYSFINSHLETSHGVLSLYNSAAHGSLRCSAELCEKATIGAMGVVMSRRLVGEVLANVPRRLGEFDWGFVEYFQSRGITILVPKRSLALHYGMHGANGDGNHTEKAIGFDENIFPKAIAEQIEKFVQGEKP